MKADSNSTSSPVPPPWGQQAKDALVEAQRMSEAAQHLLAELLDEGGGDAASFCRLDAIKACLVRLDMSVDPALEAV